VKEKIICKKKNNKKNFYISVLFFEKIFYERYYNKALVRIKLLRIASTYLVV